MLFILCGCKVNQYETNAMTQKFIEKGYEIVDFDEEADVYIVNTCTVTNMSDRKSRQIIRRAKYHNKEAVLVVTGCYAQINKEKLEQIEGVNLVLGNNEKNKIVDLVEEYINKNTKNAKTIIEDIGTQKEFLDFGNITYTEKTRAVIKVQDGCNNFCTYCIIPYSKGRVRSRQIQNVVNEVKEISKNGIKEVVITGIHIASYGKDFEEDIGLIDLLEEIQKIDTVKRIRLGSLEPKIINNDFVNRLKKLDKICNHFHLSLQSGCDATLKRMNRKYNTEEFENAVNLLRENFENVALTADVIVGFPNESDEEFNITYEFLKRIKFTKIHVFKYSPREGTVAAKMQGQIDGNIKEQRSNLLLELSDKYEQEFLSSFIGKNIEVLFEETEGEYTKGHTGNYILVKAKEQGIENEIKIVKIEKYDESSLIGEVVS